VGRFYTPTGPLVNEQDQRQIPYPWELAGGDYQTRMAQSSLPSQAAGT